MSRMSSAMQPLERFDVLTLGSDGRETIAAENLSREQARAFVHSVSAARPDGRRARLVRRLDAPDQAAGRRPALAAVGAEVRGGLVHPARYRPTWNDLDDAELAAGPALPIPAAIAVAVDLRAVFS